MHDPDVVAFEIRRPWPKLRPGRLYWPPLITVWHREPGGHDSGEICRHYVRNQGADGKWQTTILHGWKFHVWHWYIQVHPLQSFRRWALTRCAWCGGRSRRGDYVNISHGWDSPPGRWWRGAPGRFHMDCSSIEHAHRSCTCETPDVERGRNHGRCVNCGRFRGFGVKPIALEAQRLLKTIPDGGRDPVIYAQVEALWAAYRETEKTVNG